MTFQISAVPTVESLEGRVLFSTLLKKLPHGDDVRFEAIDGKVAYLEIIDSATGAPNGILRTNGTAAGTFPIADSKDTSLPAILNGDLSFYPAGGKVYVLTRPGEFGGRAQLWVINEQNNTAVLLHTFKAPPFDRDQTATVLNGDLYFDATDSVDADQTLWRSDGTVKGTVFVKRVLPPSEMTVLDGTLYFFGTLAGGYPCLYRSNGTAADTKLIVGLPELEQGIGDGGIHHIVALHDRLYFELAGETPELWTTDGTAKGTTRMGTFMFGENEILAGTNHLYFTAYGKKGEGVWISDGTTAGTHPIDDLVPGLKTEQSGQVLAVVGDEVYFNTDTSFPYRDVWRSDGTAAGTKKLNIGFHPIDIFPMGGQTDFLVEGNSDFVSDSLYTTQGSASTTNLLIPDIITDPPFLLNGKYIFTHDLETDRSEVELRRYDPTTGSITGAVFADSNHNGQQDTGEQGLQGWRVFLDLNGDGLLDNDEPFTRTSSTGHFEFDDLEAGTYWLRLTQVGGYTSTGSTAYRVIIAPTQIVTKKFGEEVT